MQTNDMRVVLSHDGRRDAKEPSGTHLQHDALRHDRRRQDLPSRDLLLDRCGTLAGKGQRRRRALYHGRSGQR